MTTIGKSIVIDGEISSDEDLIIQGTVKGKISSKENLVVESSGVVEATVETAGAIISGQVKGSMRSSGKIEITAGGRMVGDVKAPRILIADGAAFKGTVEMDV
ncbi:MAG: polymer-forming cytoskeletal protein [Pseudomonadota bacterium]